MLSYFLIKYFIQKWLIKQQIIERFENKYDHEYGGYNFIYWVWFLREGERQIMRDAC